MTNKTFRFDEKDEETFELLREKLPFARNDMDIIRFCLYAYLSKDSLPEGSSFTHKKKEPEVSEDAQLKFDKCVKENDLCPLHPAKCVSDCGCIENGELLKWYAKRY